MNKNAIVPLERIEHAILVIRGHGVEAKVLNQAVKRNIERFPADFMFQLTAEDADHLRSQSVTSSSWGGRRYPVCDLKTLECTICPKRD